MALLSKQMYFSRLYKQSQAAYYAADDAISCAISIDDTYTSDDGLGIFPSSTTTDPGIEPGGYMYNVVEYINLKRTTAETPLPAISLDDIKCGGSPIFKYASSSITVSPTNYKYFSPSAGVEEGKTVTFTMRMDLGADPNDITGIRHLYRCSKVTVNKTPSFRQIVAQGYSSCDSQNTTVERAVINTTIAE